MRDLAQTRNRFMLWLSLMAVLSVAFLVYLLWPGARGPQPEALRARYQSLKHEVELWHRSNPEKTREALKAFYAQNVATRPSQISQEVEKLVREKGVATQGIKYDFSKTTEKNAPPSVQLIKVDTTVTGDYTKIAQFVNALEQSKLLFIIDSISLSNQEGGSVTLHLSFDTFLKEAA
jgi:Tfp pilus assembly protein PilO